MSSEWRSLEALGPGLLAFALVAGAGSGARAQERVVVEPSAEPPGHLQIIVEPPPPETPERAEPAEPPRAPMSEEDAKRRAELSWMAFRMRNIFFGSMAATAVGAALVFPAEANQCNSTDPDGGATLNRCTPGGKAMVIIGYPLLVVGGIAMLTSGIMFGITKGKLRRFEQRAARRESRTLRWDPARSGFAF